MSALPSYEPKDFRVGEPIDQKVADHIADLQNVFGAKDGDARLTYIDLQGALPWIKLQSGAVLSKSAAADYGTAEGDILAKENILFGVNARTESKDKDGNTSISFNPDAGVLPGYENTTQFGVRPKPGITGMSIQSHNRFGSLRTAVVTFQCWSKEQMDKMEVLFMRPGLTALLEWGHSKVLTSTTRVVPADYGIDYFTADKSMPSIMQKIQKKRETQGFSYDGIVGIIKNFSWSFRPDGGYDCQVHLVTSGDLIESYKASFYVEQTKINDALLTELEEVREESNTPSGSIKLEFPSVLEDTDTPYSLTDLPELSATFSRFCGSVEKALAESFTHFEAAIASLDEEGKLKMFEEGGIRFNRKLGLTTLLEETKKLFGSLALVKSGTKIATLNKYKLQDGANYLTPVQKGVVINSLGEWKEGRVNLNTAENKDFFDLKEGSKITTGWVALLPLQGSYPDMPSFVTAVRKIHQNENVSNTDACSAVMNLLKKGRYISGNKNEQLFKFDASASNPIWQNKKRGYKGVTEKGLNDRDAKILYEGIFLDTTKAKSPGNAYGLDVTLSAADSENTSKSKSAAYYRGRQDPQGVLTRKFIEATTSYGATADGIGPALFIPAKFTGFQLYETLKEDRSQVITVTDEEGRVDTYVDPNDDNLSKLHYILRTKFETPYVNSYLGEDTGTGTNFSGFFRYRPVFTPVDGGVPAELEEIFAEKFGTTRMANLKRYDNDPSYNTYLKQMNVWGYVLGGRFKGSDAVPTYNTLYIKLGALLELINKHVLQSETNYFFLFKSTYRNAKTTPLYRTMDDHISTDPEICILPHTIPTLKIEGRETIQSSLVDPDAPIILNIELGFNFVLNTLNKYIDANGEVTILSFVQEILNEIVRVTGGINDLQIQYVENSSLFHIVDRVALAQYGKSSYPEINVFGLDSIIRNVGMVSKITPKMSSMIAISAQDSSFTSTKDASGFSAIMNGVTDRIFKDRYDEDQRTKTQAASGSYDTLRDTLINDVIDLKVHLESFYWSRTIPRHGRDTQPGVYQNFLNFLSGADSTYRKGGRPVYNFIIPFELQLDMYGLSGIQVMDAFVINKDILPKTYGGRKDSPVGFIVTGVEHTIDRTNWTTKLKTQIFNLDDKQPQRDFPESNIKLFTGKLPEGESGGGAPSGGKVKGRVWKDLNEERRKNAVFLYKLLTGTYKFSDLEARAILGIVSKESGFAPRPEDSYKNTKPKRLREIWGWMKPPKYDDATLLALVQDETKFWDTVYGYLNPNLKADKDGKKSFYGNSAPGDGKKYLGRGFNGLTFKGAYVSANDRYKNVNSPAGVIDLVSTPDDANRKDADGLYRVAAHLCALYFQNTMKTRSSNTTQTAALLDAFWANAGYGKKKTDPAKWLPLDVEGYTKAQNFINSLPAKIE